MLYTIGKEDKAVSAKQALVGGVNTFNDRNVIIELPVDKEEIIKGTKPKTPVEETPAG